MTDILHAEAIETTRTNGSGTRPAQRPAPGPEADRRLVELLSNVNTELARLQKVKQELELAALERMFGAPFTESLKGLSAALEQ